MSTPSMDNSRDKPDPFFIRSVVSPQWANAEKTMIQCVVMFPNHPLGFTGPMPFTADSRDTEVHGQALYHRLTSGEFGAIGDYQPPSDDVLGNKAQQVVADALVRTQLRVDQHRDELEAGSETTLTAAQFATLQKYRADLRNVKKQPGYPKTIDWPIEPAL